MKRNIIILAIIALVFSGCRKDADYHPYIGEHGSLAYSNYSEQFEHIWKCMSTGYVMWDIEETDWDAVYDEYMPKFQALDAQHEAGIAVYTSELAELYTGAMGGMKDHHMTVLIRNLFPPIDDATTTLTVRPGFIETATRDYYVESIGEEQPKIMSFLDDITSQYNNVTVHETATANVAELGTTVTYYYCLFTLDDGRVIPYLWQSLAALTPTIRCLGQNDEVGQAAALIDHWMRAITETPREQLAGIILDNRANRGGYQDDLDLLIGSFINERTSVLQTRYKEGPGRLEYSPWTSYYLNPDTRYHRDLTAENIPYVVICDINSISMGEIEPMTISSTLPTSYVIGERTFGATCPLQPTESIDLNYGGPFGDAQNDNHYVYTATFESKCACGMMEGIGFTPNKVINRKDYNGDFKPQLDAAIEYIRSVH